MSQQLLFADSAPQRAQRRTANRHGHAARLALVLGNGADWEYTGDCYDLQFPTGRCACGHIGLRYEFSIRHKTNGRTAIVGSTCIEHYSEINPAMVATIAADLERLQREASERLEAAQRNSRDPLILRALDEFDAAAWELDRRIAEGAERFIVRDFAGNESYEYVQRRRVSHAIYRDWHSGSSAAQRVAEFTEGTRYPHRWRQFVKPTAFLAHIRRETARVHQLLQGPIWAD